MNGKTERKKTEREENSNSWKNGNTEKKKKRDHLNKKFSFHREIFQKVNNKSIK